MSYILALTCAHRRNSRIDIATGDFTGHLILGDPTYESQLNDIVVTSGTAFYAGFTEDFMPGTGFRGWFVEVDLSDTPAWTHDPMDLVPWIPESATKIRPESPASPSTAPMQHPPSS